MRYITKHSFLHGSVYEISHEKLIYSGYCYSSHELNSRQFVDNDELNKEMIDLEQLTRYCVDMTAHKNTSIPSGYNELYNVLFLLVCLFYPYRKMFNKLGLLLESYESKYN